MAVRSRRFFGPTSVAASTTVLLYTVPADRTARFSLITITSTSTTSAMSFMRLASTGSLIHQVDIVGNGGSAPFPYELVLNPGDTLYFQCPAGVTAQVTGFGSLLDGAPA